MSKKNKEADSAAKIEREITAVPDSEAWTYHVDGLKAPVIGVPVKNAKIKKVTVVIVLLVAISLSMLFSIRAIHSDIYNYEELENGWEFVKFSNPGTVTELSIDYAFGEKDKPITEVHEYALNCDDKIVTINIGKDVEKIDGKSFYSVWNLQNIFVDEENEYYRDLDGVLYNKDLTEVICYPIDHDAYLRSKAGYEEELWPDNDKYDEAYEQAVRTYKLPETVTKVGDLAFNYANLVTVYLPEGLKSIGTLSFFKATSLENVISYKGEETYVSLPEGLETIGSDAFSYNQAMEYMFIPSSVKEIGHHAFWDTVYKKSGELKGISVMNVAVSEEEFNSSVKAGDHWIPNYDYNLFKKNIEINYSCEREAG